MGKLGRRIERVKAEPFLDALQKVDPGFEIPSRLPKHVPCPFPDHNEVTGSFYVQEHRWYCFGCGRGGDVVDYVQHMHNVSIAVAVEFCERALGFNTSDLSTLAALARRRGEVPERIEAEWRQFVLDLDEEFLNYMRPLLRCEDFVVADIAWSRADYVFSELDDVSGRSPLTERGLRESKREIRSWALDWAYATARDVERATGKDRLDCALQGPLRYLKPSFG